MGGLQQTLPEIGGRLFCPVSATNKHRIPLASAGAALPTGKPDIEFNHFCYQLDITFASYQKGSAVQVSFGCLTPYYTSCLFHLNQKKV